MIRKLCSILLLTCLFGCNKQPSDFKYVIDKLEEYYATNKHYPENLENIGINEPDLCYYLDDIGFNLEFTSGDDLYWFNKGNSVWDYLEGDADQIKCENN